MNFVAFIAISLLAHYGVATGGASISGQWISQDSVRNLQNVLQIQTGEQNGIVGYVIIASRDWCSITQVLLCIG